MSTSSTGRMPQGRCFGWVECAAAAVTVIVWLLATQASAESDAVSFEVTGATTGAIVSGDDARFKERQRIPTDASGGISDLFIQSDDLLGGTLRLRGRALFDTSDYLVDLRYKRDDGYLKAGYREFRTWSDGSGGFFPPNGAFITPFREDHQLDRGDAWLDVGLGSTDDPMLRLTYRHLFRDGRKDSVAWGDTQLTGGAGTRNIVPTFWSIDEKRDIVTADVHHDLAGTDVGAGFRYERSKIDNARDITRRPGEAGVERLVTQRDAVGTDLFNAHAFSETKLLDEKVVLTTAYSYTDVESDLGGSRVYGSTFDAGFDPMFANRQRFDAGFHDLTGTSKLRRHVGSFNVMGLPSEDLRAIAAVRVEHEDTEALASQVATDVGPAPLLTYSETPLSVQSASDLTKVAESLELRYTAIDDVILYARAEFEQTERGLSETETDTLASTVDLQRATNADVGGQKYAIGANWYPTHRVSVTGKYYYELSDVDFAHPVDSTDNTSPNRYPAYLVSQDIEAHGADVRLSLRALDNLRLALRYDLRRSNVDTRADQLAQIQSGAVTSHALGGSANWTPVTSVFVQANASYVLSETNTPANSLTGPAEGLVTDYNNDYWSANLLSGWAMDDKTDLELRYVFYLADNYKNNSTFSQPYGAAAEEHGVSLALKRKINEHVSVKGMYGFFTNHDRQFGGRDDYDAHLVGGSVQYDF
jgi:hypothetical protein